jgi:hypothetical protein
MVKKEDRKKHHIYVIKPDTVAYTIKSDSLNEIDIKGWPYALCLKATALNADSNAGLFLLLDSKYPYKVHAEWSNIMTIVMDDTTMHSIIATLMK